MDIREESRQLVKVSNGVWIVFVVVTLVNRSPHQTAETLRTRPRRKGKVLLAESHLHESLEQTVVTRGHQLLIGRVSSKSPPNCSVNDRGKSLLKESIT